jgi:predicted nucleic acid-binding protein
MTAESFLDARLFNERYQLSHWDGLILAAVKEAQCQTLYSEDLQNGQSYDGITIVNPFASTVSRLKSPTAIAPFTERAD